MYLNLKYTEIYQVKNLHSLFSEIQNRVDSQEDKKKGGITFKNLESDDEDDV